MLTRIKKLFCACTFALLLTAGLYSQEVEEIKIDAGQRLGKISHGATGFLYGLGDPGIPARQLLSALHPVTAAQKAPAGIQHPNGDALEVAEDFFSSGGKQLQVYMQDIYKQWPYEKLGMSDYLPKIKAMVKKGKESTYRNNLAWIPLNEPDVIWYNDSNLLPSFLADWKLCYEAIKDADPSAKVVGPNTTKYGENFFDSFLKFSKENNCLPDIITWHELQDDFYSDWENHYNSYRSLEKKYGIKNLPITINEYARFSGDLAMPGKLVQFISRFENVGVNGCLAYWTTAGSLNDLVTRNTYPTGAWYLYYWYGQMSGERLMVQNQKLECEGLQALAVLDAEKNQIRTILGGSSKEIKVELQDIGKVLKLQKKGVASLVLKKINSSDLNPSIPPFILSAENVELVNDSLEVKIPSGNENDAYLLLVGGDDFSRNMDSGKKGMWTFFADEENLSFDSKDLELVAEVFEDGYYNIKVLGTDLKNLSVQVNKDYRYDFSSSDSLTLYLGQGINLFNFSAQNLSKAKINLRKVKSLPEQTKIYQAEAEANERGSRVTLTKDGNAVEQKNHSVTSEQFLTIKNIFAEKAGTYAVTVRYQNGELGDGAANYNSNIVDRSAFLKVNGSPVLSSRKVFFRNTLGWKDWYTLTFSLQLEEGNNSISFVAPEHKKLPTVDFIRVSPLVLEKSVSGFEDASPLLQLSPATSVRYPRQIELNAIFADDTFANSDVKIKWSTKNKKVRFINADSPFAKAEVSKAGNYTFTCTVSDGKYSVSKDLTATVYPEGMYEAEDEKNIINGQARIAASSLASNKKIVGYIGMGEQNSLVFTNIKAKKKGNHKITLYYISGENRKVLLYVNDKSPIWVECPSTGDWSKVGSVSVKVKLEKGDNTITFKNPLNYAPDIDCIVVE